MIQRGTEQGEFVLVAQALQIQIQIQVNKTQIVVDHYFPYRFCSSLQKSYPQHHHTICAGLCFLVKYIFSFFLSSNFVQGDEGRMSTERKGIRGIRAGSVPNTSFVGHFSTLATLPASPEHPLSGEHHRKDECSENVQKVFINHFFKSDGWKAFIPENYLKLSSVKILVLSTFETLVHH